MPGSEKVFFGGGRMGDRLWSSTVDFAPDDDGRSVRCWTMNACMGPWSPLWCRILWADDLVRVVDFLLIVVYFRVGTIYSFRVRFFVFEDRCGAHNPKQVLFLRTKNHPRWLVLRKYLPWQPKLPALLLHASVVPTRKCRLLGSCGREGGLKQHEPS